MNLCDKTKIVLREIIVPLRDARDGLLTVSEAGCIHSNTQRFPHVKGSLNACSKQARVSIYPGENAGRMLFQVSHGDQDVQCR